ncbi:MAG: hypothetical protein WDN24_13240 [Sphingomonas sp.]
MLLIMSGAYLNSEFTAEFGRLPPSFLPVGNKRLFRWQLDLLEHVSDRIVMSLSERFRDERRRRGVPGRRRSGGRPHAAGPLARGGRGLLPQRQPRLFRAGLPAPRRHARRRRGPRPDRHAVVATTSEYYQWAEVERDGSGNAGFREGLSAEQKSARGAVRYFTPSPIRRC